MATNKRIIYIGSPCYLRFDNGRMVMENHETGEIIFIPLDDIGIIELDNSAIVVSAYCLAMLAEQSIAVVFCGKSHSPVSLSLPIKGNSLQSKRIQSQISISQSLIRQLWTRLIVSKINNQSKILKFHNRGYRKLEELVKIIRIGDPDNKEARASRYYWTELFGKNFKRGRYAAYPNNLLNYSYSIIRSNVARSLVSVGLCPSIGLHHTNQYNSFCLADDIMEPYRPFADAIVVELYNEYPGGIEICKPIKERILKLSFADCLIDNALSPINVAIQRTCYSLAECFENNSLDLICPNILE